MSSGNGTGAGTGAFLMAESLSGERPKNTLSKLQSRARRSQLVAESLAEYLGQRAKLEDEYCRGLQKLQRKPIIAESYRLHLGEGLERIRQRLETEMEETAQLHDSFQLKIEKEVVGVLRDKAKIGETALKQHDTAAEPLVKTWDEMKARLEKAQGKAGQNAAKVQVAQQDIAQAQQHWRTTVAPQLFTAYDQADRARIEATKESLAKYATMQNDLGRDGMDIAARVLNDVIIWDLDEDMSDWLRAEGGGRDGVIQGLGRNDRVEMREPARPQQTDSSLASVAAARPASAMERTPSINSGRNERTGAGGLFAKLKPSMNRQRSSSRADSYGNLDVPGGDRSSVYSAEGAPEGPTPLGRSVASRTSAGTEDDHVGNMSFSSTTTREDKRRSFVPSMLRRKNSTAQDRKVQASKASQAPSGALSPPVDDDNDNLAPSSINTTPRQAATPIPAVQTAPTPRVDADGFSVPPPGHDAQPWTAAASGGPSLMDEDDGASHLRSSSLAIQPSTIQESSNERQAAMDKVKSALLSSAPQGSVARRGTARDRRAVRSAMYSSTDEMSLPQTAVQQTSSTSALPAALTGATAGASVVGAASMLDKAQETLSSPTTSSATPISNGADSSTVPDSPFSTLSRTPATSDAQRSMSMISSSSQAAAMPGASLGVFDNPHGEGLRAALIEKVQIMVKGGTVERVTVTGEVSLLLRSAATKPLRVRLSQTATFEKSKPNTTYFAPVDGSDGQYEINAAALSAASVSAPVPVFRYHYSIASDPSNEVSPVYVHPQWKCEPTQTSVLVNYRAVAAARMVSGNTSSPFDEASSAVLKDVTLEIPITSTTVGGVQTRPHGNYLSDKRKLRFNLADLDVGSSEQHKVLARLAVGEQSQVQPVTLNFTLHGRLLSGVGIELTEQGAVALQEVVQLTKGNLLAA